MKLLMLPLLLLASLPALCAETMIIDPSHSAVVFHWNHFGFSNPVARFEKIEGKLVLDEADLAKSSVTVKLALDGLRTGDDFLNKRLKTAEFLDAATYPDISFQSTGIVKGPMNTLKITGNLSVHGVTRSVVLDATVNKIHTDPQAKTGRAGFDAETVIRRSDYGVDKYVPAVTDELFIHITLEANVEE